MKAYIDSDVLIWHLRGEQKALLFLSALRSEGRYDLWTGALQRAEVVFFMRPAEEKPTELFLAQFKIAPVDQTIIDLAGRLYRRWHPGHGVYIHDSILAATVMKTGGVLYTLNNKHYPMPDVVVYRAW